MKGLTYLNNISLTAKKPIDLTKFWSQTVMNASNFSVDGTDLVVTLCGEFDHRTQCHLMLESNIAILTNGESDVFLIDMVSKKVKYFCLYWSFFKYIDSIMIFVCYNDFIFVFKNDKLLEYGFDSGVNAVDIDLKENKLFIKTDRDQDKILSIDLERDVLRAELY